MVSAYQKLSERIQEANKIARAYSLIEWDEEIAVPKATYSKERAFFSQLWGKNRT